MTRDFMSMLGVLRERYFSGDAEAFGRKVEKLSTLLSEMSDVLENEDWILLADLLEYEFLPLCEEWRAVSEDLHRQMAKSVAQ